MKLIFSKRKPKFGDEWMVDSSELKEICQIYFFNEYGIFLDDGGSGYDDNLYEFKVNYNDFYHIYRFSLIGSSELQDKIDNLIKWFKKEKYKVTKPERTWTWKYEGKKKDCINGLMFEVKAVNAS